MSESIQWTLSKGQEDVKLSELEKKLQALGYDLDELENDNPYNQWMNEVCQDVTPAVIITQTVVSERIVK